jgi:hypothetical protein
MNQWPLVSSMKSDRTATFMQLGRHHLELLGGEHWRAHRFGKALDTDFEEVGILCNPTPNVARLHFIHIPIGPDKPAMQEFCFMTSSPNSEVPSKIFFIEVILSDIGLGYILWGSLTYHHQMAHSGSPPNPCDAQLLLSKRHQDEN